MRPAVFVLVLTASASTLFAAVTPSTMFGNGMVLQREMPVPVWGRAAPGERVTVRFSGQAKSTTADPNGKWMVKLDALTASAAGATMVISGRNEVTFSDVLVGEVWVCSGQSNMQMGHGGIPQLKKLLPEATRKPLRHFAVTTFVSFEPMENCRGAWSTRPAGSAVAFGFSYYLYEQLRVPVAVIQTCWGSSSIEGWMPIDMTGELPHFAQAMKTFEEKDRERVSKLLSDAKTHPKGAPRCWAGKDNVYLRTRPNILYNAMMHPVAPYAARGLVWYQGEANAGKPDIYARSLPAWVKRLRTLWGRDDFHFFAVMLPRFGRVYGRGVDRDTQYPDNFSWAWFREAQMKVLDLPHTGVANTIDLGEMKNIHPKDKEPIGRRLALLAARDVNGEEATAEGPKFKGIRVNGSSVAVSFENAEGLRTNDGKPPAQFWLAGSDKEWVRGKAEIKGRTVVVTAVDVDQPVAVRYAFSAFPQANLVNGAGLPAYPFRSDAWVRK
jgi:sialate O-acetylesterase